MYLYQIEIIISIVFKECPWSILLAAMQSEGEGNREKEIEREK